MFTKTKYNPLTFNFKLISYGKFLNEVLKREQTNGK